MTADTERPSPARRSLLANSALLSTTAVAVSAANYLLNVALARLLPPSQFGDVSLVVNLVLAGSLVAATLQLVASRATAANPAARDRIRVLLVRAAVASGALTLLGLGGGSWALAEWLRASTPWLFVVLGLGLPVYFVQAVHRGILQGELRFSRLALSYGTEALIRVGVTLALVAVGSGVLGAAIGVAASFVASALVARVKPLGPGSNQVGLDLGLRSAVLAATVLLLGQTVVNTADLVIAKARFDADISGVYAAAALVGRALTFISSAVMSSVFPVLARDNIAEAERRRALWGAVGLVCGVGLLGTLAVGVAGHLLVAVAFGPSYAEAEPLLVPYALATALFAVANLLATADVARRRIAAATVLAGGAVAQTAVLALWGSTPLLLVWLQVAAMAATIGAIAVIRIRRGNY